MHSAHYDKNGNIILGSKTVEKRADDDCRCVQISVRSNAVSATSCPDTWTVIHEAPPPQKSLPADTVHSKKSMGPGLNLARKAGRAIAEGAAEGATQLHATVHEATIEAKALSSALRSIPGRVRGAAKRFAKHASTPVRMPSLIGRSGKPPTKLKLFIVDTVRFGGTFAGIFIVLFIGINAQSFFQIAKAELAIGSDLEAQQALEEIVSGRSDQRATLNAGMISEAASDLRQLLPAVGPFENRLIIPKLNKNIPIVRPSMDGLMQEDWKKFEEDIQVALKDGVVHYPGSARPGQAGNFFVTGHSSYYPWDDGSYKDVFARLKDLNPGDTYSVYYGGDRHTYRISSKKEVKPSDVSVLDQPTNKRISTLMTCTPVGTTLRRLVVMAEEIDPATGETLNIGEKLKEDGTTPAVRLESLPI